MGWRVEVLNQAAMEELDSRRTWSQARVRLIEELGLHPVGIRDRPVHLRRMPQEDPEHAEDQIALSRLKELEQ